MARIAVVDYGMGNLRSVTKAIEHVAPQFEVLLTGDPQVVREADRVVFPGQGAMRDCMREMDAKGLRTAVLEASRHKPFLGICIGLQMLFEHSEEGDTPGLAVLPGRVRRFPADRMTDAQGNKLKVPHMGWNEVHQSGAHPMWDGIADGARFYFVHSYFAEPAEPDLIAAYSLYPFAFTCAAARGNIFAVQFHPEKSADAGLRLLANFAKWQPAGAESAPARAESGSPA
jgi:imidazole glycerol-phosphate synthase subunit HisH